ncbi:hypothetical protein L596_007541 [Steinernema carpocapsae]|uniref:Uncharacterized protein n=1 Tax=Steinernema carpocapsae TaxID=34508 RepID=A0A4U5PAM9_STECR|nr:hypothetical protein L596_007541 [Steinernema carpocapsae]
MSGAFDGLEISRLSLDLPDVSSSSPFSSDSASITVYLKFGANFEAIACQRSESPAVFEAFQAHAKQFIQKFSKSTPKAVVHFFFHQFLAGAPTLVPLKSLSQLSNGSTVELILLDNVESQDYPHRYKEIQLFNPTFCDFCQEIIGGLFKQAVKCRNCRCKFHKRCVNQPRNSCSVAINQLTATPSEVELLRKALPHSLQIHNYLKPTKCAFCNQLLVGIRHQGLQCRDCKVNVHEKCASKLPMDCHIADDAIANFSESGSFADLESFASGPSVEPFPRFQQLPLWRLSGQPGHIMAQARHEVVAEGWVIHFLLSDPERRLRNYWVLVNGAINMYNEYNNGVNQARVFKQLQLAEIISIKIYNGNAISNKYLPHVFEIRTVSNLTYCVGENFDDDGPRAKMPRYSQESNQGVTTTSAWYQILSRSLQPPTTQNASNDEKKTLDFAEAFQLMKDNELGSGQFGCVYTAIHRQTKVEYAVKILKMNPHLRQSSHGEALKNEVSILQAMRHPGIIQLKDVFDTKDSLLIVMEKMRADMLEMILSQENGCLDERATRYLLVQILTALKYLHSQGIAHCDLKPENVLLSDMNSNFPQSKLCDFGYARFIGDDHFRKTIVGTPAYLAPEVLQKKGYNKSLDMWSVGVVIYVTLSGTFPFSDNDLQNIETMLKNSNALFPTQHWGEISHAAIDLITKLFQINIAERLSVDECLHHKWFQNFELYMDLRSLERRLGMPRFLTSDEDDKKYAAHLHQNNLTPGLI